MVDLLIIVLHLIVYLMPRPASSCNSERSKFYHNKFPDCKWIKSFKLHCDFANLNFQNVWCESQLTTMIIMIAPYNQRTDTPSFNGKIGAVNNQEQNNSVQG